MGMGTINKVFVVSTAQPEQQRGRQAGAYNLLWSEDDHETADSFLGQQCSRNSSGNGDTGSGQPRGQQAANVNIDWRKGAYAIRFRGSEFVTSKALAHSDAAIGGDAKVGRRYSGSAGIADVHAQPEPVQAAAAGSGLAPAAAASSEQDVQQEQEQQQLAATMWIAGSEAQAMEERDQVGFMPR